MHSRWVIEILIENKYVQTSTYCNGMLGFSIIVLITECGSGYAYHSGKMIKDFHSDKIDHPYECLQKCNSEETCNFWDYGQGWCRLRSTSGEGPQNDFEYSYGTKNCKFIFEEGKK